ncbi:MAG: universal stress protein [Gaiellaceae bacterium]
MIIHESTGELVAALGTAAGILDRVLCGVDETPESLEAVRQAARLRAPDGSLDIVAAVDLGGAAQADWAATAVAADLEAEAKHAIEAARLEVPEATHRLLEGRPSAVLLSEAGRTQATLIALGSHGHRRSLGIALGSVTATVVHDAPCSVLVARSPLVQGGFPDSIVVGIDGSPESAVAAAFAFELGRRFGVGVRPVAASSGKTVDLEAVHAIAPEAVVRDRPPVEALVTASTDVDLLVVGNRGLHGLRALGSVSERVVHQARCSVLVARTPADP